MKPLKIIQISDTHLSQKRAYAQQNWEATLRYLDSAKPDLVIHTGDIILDDPDDLEDHEFGYAQLNRISSPWKVVPGGHDLGDSPPQPWMGQYITTERRERFLQFYSTDHWSLALNNWNFIGINCQLFESDPSLKDVENSQWKYIENEFIKSKGLNIALFFHKPPCQSSLAESGDSVSFIPSSSRKILLELSTKYKVRLICTGHRHRYITFQSHDISIVCAPTTGLLSEEDNQSCDDGIQKNGLVEYSFNTHNAPYQFIQPPGVKFIRYGPLDPSIPLGSRFLPLYRYPEEMHE